MEKNHKNSILIIEDDRDSIGILLDALTGKNFRVFVAENGSEGIQAGYRIRPDIILLGLRLPDTDGFEVCRILKDHPETENIPIIFITGAAETAERIRCFDFGAADYITKPFDCARVPARIQIQLDMRLLRESIRQERDRFRMLAEVTSEGIVFHDRGQIAETNPAMEDISGYSSAELNRMHISELFPPEFHPLLSEEMADDSGQTHEVRGRKKNGSFSVLRIRQKTVQYKGKNFKMLAVRDISEKKKPEPENRVLCLPLRRSGHFGDMVGESAAMQKVYKKITQIAQSDESVMICGETGTGKELTARMIFRLDKNYKRVFIAVNCASVPATLFESQFFGYCKGAFTGASCNMPGFFQQAEGGILFLDEVGELTPEMQSKLLRVLESGEYIPVGTTVPRLADVRIIAATNRNMREMVSQGKMRADFFHRLNVIRLNLPPLRERREDIPLLAEFFLAETAGPDGLPPSLSPQFLEQLQTYDWPGNVRELFNVLRRFRVNGTVTPEASSLLPEPDTLPFLPEDAPLREAVEAFEKYYIRRILNRYRGRKRQTAEILGINRRTLYNKLNTIFPISKK